jgi:hypothetical protein
MTILSRPDPTADIACTLPPNDGSARLRGLQAIVGGEIANVARLGGRLRLRINRAGRADLEAQVTTWAEEEKACCAFLGFAVDSEPEAVTIEISSPAGAELTLDGIEWLIRAAGRQHGAA